MRRPVHVLELPADLVGAVEREQSGDGERQDGLHVPGRGSDETAAMLGQGAEFRIGETTLRLTFEPK